MRMNFNLVVAGKDSLEKKFQEALNSNPELHISLIRSFGQAIMLGLRLTQEDEIVIESFTAGKISENATVSAEDEKKL